jgi:hypothetical protein
MTKILDRQVQNDFEFAINSVVSNSGIPRKTMFNKTRRDDVVRSRKVLFCLLRNKTNHKLKDIASLSGNTHASVSLYASSFHDMYEYDNEFRGLYNNCLAEFNLYAEETDTVILLDEMIRVNSKIEELSHEVKALKHKLISNQNKQKWQKNSM